MEIRYLCDGEMENCAKTSCYRNRHRIGGPCRRTGDINHALNFKEINGKFYEKEDTPKIRGILKRVLGRFTCRNIHGLYR